MHRRRARLGRAAPEGEVALMNLSNRWLRIAVAAVLVAAVAILIARGVMRAAEPSPDVEIGVDLWIGFAPLHLAKELGFFAEEGVHVSLITMQDTADMRAALSAGRVDGVTTSVDTAVRNRAAGTPGRIALLLDRSAGADGMVARSPVQTIADLKGRQIGVQEATPGEFFLFYQLQRAGLGWDDVKRVPLNSDDAATAFIAGELDAVVTWEPSLSRAAAAPGARMLASTAGDEVVIVDALVLHDAVLDERPEAARAIRRAWFRAVEYLTDHPADAIERMAPTYGVTPEAFGEMVSGLRYLDAAANARLLEATGQGKGLASVIDAANGIVESREAGQPRISPDDLIHPVAQDR